MNQHPGVIGKKLGMTQVFTADGTVIPCTVIESHAVVVGKRTAEKHGYDALIVGLGERSDKHTNKALAGAYKKAGVSPKRTLRELRCTAEFAAAYEPGQKLALEGVFQEGQFVDVQGITKGRGFTGVMKRWGFRGGGSSHGAHEYKRHGGSIGTNMTPGRVMLGRKMPGHYGSEKTSVLNQRIVKLLPEEGLIFVRGGVPGSKNALVFVKGAIKKRGGKS